MLMPAVPRSCMRCSRVIVLPMLAFKAACGSSPFSTCLIRASAANAGAAISSVRSRAKRCVCIVLPTLSGAGDAPQIHTGVFQTHAFAIDDLAEADPFRVGGFVAQTEQ